MRKPLSSLFFGVLLTIGALSVPSLAWSNLRDEVRQFQLFLQDHPKVSTELRNNPNLVNNKKYLDKHDDLEKFLKRHPSVKSESCITPAEFLAVLTAANAIIVEFLSQSPVRTRRAFAAVPSPFTRCAQNHRSPEFNSWRHSSRRAKNKQLQDAHV